MTSISGKTLLVTGGAGAIGSNLVRLLLAFNPEKIIVLDNLSSGYLWNVPAHPRVQFVQGDIRNEDDLRRVFRAGPSHIFHLAAFFANQRSVDYPLLDAEVNVLGTLKLLEHAVLSGKTEAFIYTNSEGGAYGSDNPLPYTEARTSLKLGSPYYITKHTGEMYCNFYAAHYGLPVTVLRLFNSYGPGEVPGQYRNVIPNFIYWALQGKPLPLTGSSDIARDFVFVDDTARAILSAALTPDAAGHVLNVASGKPVFIHELARKINELTGNTAGCLTFPARKWDQRPQILGDTRTAAELIGFECSTPFEEGLAKAIQWFRDHAEHIRAAADFPPGMSAAVEGYAVR